MMPTKQEQLQELANELRTDHQHEFWIEYRPNRGWFAVASEPLPLNLAGLEMMANIWGATTRKPATN